MPPGASSEISPSPDEVTVGGCRNSNAVIALQRANERATVYLHADNLWNSNYNEYVGFLAPGMSIRPRSAPGFLTGRL